MTKPHWLAALIAVSILSGPSAGWAQTNGADPQPDQATSTTPGMKPSIITRPDWARIPSASQISRLYPKRAAREKVQGRVVLRCQVTKAGALTECRVLSETPEGYGFGDAALKLSKMFVMRPKTVDGAPVDDAWVNIPLPFRMR
jgi:protein TonB